MMHCNGIGVEATCFAGTRRTHAQRAPLAVRRTVTQRPLSGAFGSTAALPTPSLRPPRALLARRARDGRRRVAWGRQRFQLALQGGGFFSAVGALADLGQRDQDFARLGSGGLVRLTQTTIGFAKRRFGLFVSAKLRETH